MLPEASSNSLESLPDKTIDSETIPDANKPLEELPVETLSTDEIVSAQKENMIAKDSENLETVDHDDQVETNLTADDSRTAGNGKIDTENSSPIPPHDVENSKGLTLSADTTMEMVIGEISYSECSDKPQKETTLGDIPPNVSSMQPIETSSVASELPEFSHTPDTTLTNSLNGSSPP